LNEFYYKEIDENEVDPLKIKEANRVLNFCKNLLALPDLRIQWYVKVEKESFEKSHSILFGEIIRNLERVNKYKEEFCGMVKVVGHKNKIFIRADILLDGIKRTIAHECSHHSNFRHYGLFNDERRAEGFAREVMSEINNY